MTPIEPTGYELFQSEIIRWIDFFGLKDYCVAFSDEVTDPDYFAQCSTSLPDRTAIFRFAPDESLDEFNRVRRDIRKDAFHEVIHLLLAHLMDMAESRFLDGNALRAEEERLVRVFENTVYQRLKS